MPLEHLLTLATDLTSLSFPTAWLTFFPYKL